MLFTNKCYLKMQCRLFERIFSVCLNTQDGDESIFEGARKRYPNFKTLMRVKPPKTAFNLHFSLPKSNSSYQNLFVWRAAFRKI